MARITILSVPAYGHLIPMLGVIRELVARGHDVEVLNGEEMAPAIARTGARLVAYPPALKAGTSSRPSRMATSSPSWT